MRALETMDSTLKTSAPYLKDSLGSFPAIIADSESGKGRIERAALLLFSESTIDGVSTKRIAQDCSNGFDLRRQDQTHSRQLL